LALLEKAESAISMNIDLLSNMSQGFGSHHVAAKETPPDHREIAP
jgi:hypothetical protein